MGTHHSKVNWYSQCQFLFHSKSQLRCCWRNTGNSGNLAGAPTVCNCCWPGVLSHEGIQNQL